MSTFNSKLIQTVLLICLYMQGTPSPAGASNVDWVALQNIGGALGGTLANDVLRVDTKGGQPPASVGHLLSSLFP